MKQSNIPSNNTVIIVTVLIIIIYALSSCYTTKDAKRDLNKAYDKHPVVTAEFTRDKFPCIEVSIDTVYRIDTTYDLLEVPCPQYDINDPIHIVDTIYKDKPPINYLIPTRRTRNVMVQLPRIDTTKTITKNTKDSADVFIALAQKKVAESNLTDCNKTVQKLKNHRLYLIILCLILMGVIVLLTVTRRR